MLRRLAEMFIYVVLIALSPLIMAVWGLDLFRSEIDQMLRTMLNEDYYYEQRKDDAGD